MPGVAAVLVVVGGSPEPGSVLCVVAVGAAVSGMVVDAVLAGVPWLGSVPLCDTLLVGLESVALTCGSVV